MHKQYLEERAEKEGRVDPSMPGFTTMFWRRLMATPTATMNLSEWGVLAELALVMVPGSVEAERMFSTMTFIKDNPAEPADHPPQPVRTYLQPAHLHPL